MTLLQTHLQPMKSRSLDMIGGMINRYRTRPKSTWGRNLELFLALRALLFVGNRYTCPCCGWKLRAFTHGGSSMKVRHQGYCPRCNSKARHRRIWLFLQQNTNLLTDQMDLFHVSPKYSLSRKFLRMENLNYVAADIQNRANLDLKFDLTATPVKSDTFDAVLCVHVLEHVVKDHEAIQEMYRVLKPGGWALISVPIRLDRKTYEDPTVTSPEGRREAFGESSHVRFYGHDFRNRLEDRGFEVQLSLGNDIDHHTMDKFGLKDDENIYFCTKG